MHSIRFRYMVFLALLLVLLLLLLNTYPVIFSRDAVFEEKRSSMNTQAALLASSLAGLEQLNEAAIAEVLTFLDPDGYARLTERMADYIEPDEYPPQHGLQHLLRPG